MHHFNSTLIHPLRSFLQKRRLGRLWGLWEARGGFTVRCIYIEVFARARKRRQHSKRGLIRRDWRQQWILKATKGVKDWERFCPGYNEISFNSTSAPLNHRQEWWNYELSEIFSFFKWLAVPHSSNSMRLNLFYKLLLNDVLFAGLLLW